MQKPIAESGMVCPLHNKDVAEVCHKCAWYILVRGSDPQTGREVDTWDCSLAWLPVLLIENAKETRQGAAATEAFRNMVADHRAQDTISEVLSNEGQRYIPRQ